MNCISIWHNLKPSWCTSTWADHCIYWRLYSYYWTQSVVVVVSDTYRHDMCLHTLISPKIHWITLFLLSIWYKYMLQSCQFVFSTWYLWYLWTMKHIQWTFVLDICYFCCSCFMYFQCGELKVNLTYFRVMYPLTCWM